MQRENKWQDRIKTIFVDNQVYQNIDCIQDLCDLIQSEIDMAVAEERERTLREIHDWAYKKGGEVPFEKRTGFTATVSYTKHHFKYNKK